MEELLTEGETNVLSCSAEQDCSLFYEGGLVDVRGGRGGWCGGGGGGGGGCVGSVLGDKTSAHFAPVHFGVVVLSGHAWMLLGRD